MASNTGKMGKGPMPSFMKNMKKTTTRQAMDFMMGGKSKKGAKITRRPGYGMGGGDRPMS